MYEIWWQGATPTLPTVVGLTWFLPPPRFLGDLIVLSHGILGGPAEIGKKWGDLFILGGPKNISLWWDLLFRSISVLCNKAFCDSEIPFSLFPTY